MATEITNPIFLGIIQDMNRQMQPRAKVTTKKYSVCEAPKVSEEELLSALVDRHKGKVQFIDFWATWCGGCRRTIKEYEPIKKELGENVAFVYLTGPSSIEKTWKILIQDIVGEHYWFKRKAMGLSLETFSDERFAHVFGDRQARKYSETIHPCDTKRTGRVIKTGNK